MLLFHHNCLCYFLSWKINKTSSGLLVTFCGWPLLGNLAEVNKFTLLNNFVKPLSQIHRHFLYKEGFNLFSCFLFVSFRSESRCHWSPVEGLASNCELEMAVLFCILLKFINVEVHKVIENWCCHNIHYPGNWPAKARFRFASTKAQYTDPKSVSLGITTTGFSTTSGTRQPWKSTQLWVFGFTKR